MSRVQHLGEFGLIDRIKAFCPSSARVIKSIGDDAAVLDYTSKAYQLLTTDMLIEDVHFTRRMPAQSIGHKALACNISDIAAMGGVPTFAVVSLGIPKTMPLKWVTDFYKGMSFLAQSFKVSIVGGDTVKSDNIVINIALLGEVAKKHLVTRDGAHVGDWVFVTGPLGGSLQSGRHLTFTPRLKEARFLVENFKPNAMMDISDGLGGDLNHILKASHVGVELFDEHIPRHKGVNLTQALCDGEDFELVFTLSQAKAKRLMDWQIHNRRWFFYHIGRIIENRQARVKAPAFTHF